MVKSCLFQNGKLEFQELDKASIPVLDAAYLFGDGVYEVIAAINGRLFDLEPHLARLENSLRTILIGQPLSTQELATILAKLPEENKNGYVYLQVTRGAHIKRDFAIATDTKPTFFAYFQEQKLFPEQLEGETSILFPDIRWSMCHVKTTQLMSSRLAKKFATDNGAMEPIYVTRGGLITEGGSSNIFIAKNNQIFTHPADNAILAGITRSRVMELAGNVTEKKFTLEELLSADEVFRTSTTQGVRGITNIKIAPLSKEIFADVQPDSVWQPKQIGLRQIGNRQSAIGNITKQLAQKYIDLAHEKPPAAKTA